MSGRGRKANISYVKPPEPAFLKRIKEKVGYKEGPTVDTKKQALDIDEDGQDERKAEKDDEKPVVVVLQAGDLSQEEAERIVDKLRAAEETENVEKDTKITFKKPGKRSSSTEETNTCSTSKKAKQTPLVVPVSAKRAVGTDGADSKQVNNRSLLSFDDEEDDDD